VKVGIAPLGLHDPDDDRGRLPQLSAVISAPTRPRAATHLLRMAVRHAGDIAKAFGAGPTS